MPFKGLRFGWLRWLIVPVGIGLVYFAWYELRAPRLIDAARRALEAEDYTAAESFARLLVRSYAAARRHTGRLLLAEALLHQGRIDECVQELNRLPRDWARSAEAQLLRGEVYLAEQQPLRAEWIFRSVLDRWPNEQKAHRWLAAIYYDLGHMEGALERLETLERLCPDDARPRVLKAVIHLDRERYHDAAAAYLDALRCTPSDFKSRIGLADALVRQGDIAGAEPHLAHCRQERPDDPDVLVLQAECLRSEGALAEAAAMLDRLLHDHPQHSRALLGRAKLYLEERRPAAALAAVERILEADPYDWKAHYLAGLTYVRLGKSQQAEEAFQKVRRHQDQTRQLNQLNELAIARPRDPNVRHRLGQVCLELGKGELAEMWFRAALMLDPQHPLSHRALGELYAERGLSERANWHARMGGVATEVANP